MTVLHPTFGQLLDIWESTSSTISVSSTRNLATEGLKRPAKPPLPQLNPWSKACPGRTPRAVFQIRIGPFVQKVQVAFWRDSNEDSWSIAAIDDPSKGEMPIFDREWCRLRDSNT